MLEAEREFVVRAIEQSDVQAAANVMFKAFEALDNQRGLPTDFTLEEATGLVGGLSQSPSFSVLVAISASDGSVIGLCAIDHRDTVACVGPVAVEPRCSDKKVGQTLLRSAITLDEAKHGERGIMLQQETSNLKSFCMYVKLGFVPVETCQFIFGLVDPALTLPEGYLLRRLEETDAESCNLLFEASFSGFSRLGQITGSIEESHQPSSTAFCLTEGVGGRIVAYTTGMHEFGHIVACDRERFKALLIAVSAYMRQEGITPSNDFGFHFLGRVYPDVLLWILTEAKLRMKAQLTLMSRGAGLKPDPLSPLIYCPGVQY
jgi:predicted N-acetyltransferase YhbS